MIGLVLCGGQSSRMGSDKGLLRLRDQTWAATAAGKLAALQIPVKFSINEQQAAEYSQIFTPIDLVTDDPTLDIRGPLLGVLSTHLRYPGESIFVLACDMPLMEIYLLKELLVLAESYNGPDAFIYKNDGQPEPLCSIYQAVGLALILQLHLRNQLRRHSMKFMLDHLTVFSKDIANEQKKFFFNVNAHAELNGL